MAQRCQVCLKKAAVWNNALRKYTCNECAIAQANAQANAQASARRPATAVQVQYTPCPLCLYAATVGVRSPHPQNVNPHPIPTVADWMALNVTIQQRNMAYTQQVIQAQRSYATTLFPRRHPSLLGSLVRHYVNGATGGGTMFGGGGATMFGGGGGGVDYSSLLGGGGGGVDYSSLLGGGGGGVDYSSMLGGGGFDFSSAFGGGFN